MKACIAAVIASVATASPTGSCGQTSPSIVKDCQNVDFGSCGNACCKLDFQIPMSAQDAVDSLNKSLADGGPDRMYNLQMTAQGSLGFAKLGLHGVEFIGQVFHTTVKGYNDTINFDIEKRDGQRSKVRAFSTSQIGGALSDNGQNYKNIMMAMKTAFDGTELEYVSVDGSCSQKINRTIVDLVQSEHLSTLVSALVAADLVDTLSSPGPFTVFAPTNDAFKALPADTLDDLMKPENKAELVNILKYHVLQRKVLSSEFGLYETFTTMQGQKLAVQIWGGMAHVGASSASQKDKFKTITSEDNVASNGAVHIIDGVLLPANTVSV